MADTPTNAELAAEVVGAVAAVRGAQGTVEQAATLLASHLGDPKAHGAETKANILAAVPKPVWDGKNLGFKNDDNSLSVPSVDLSGPVGPKGDPGLTPSHQWDGTKLKFQNPDGTWPASGTELKSDSTADAQQAATVATGAAERAESSELSVAANADVASQKATMASTAADTATTKAQEASTSATAAATSATAAATSAQNAAKSAADSATNATLTAASVDAVTVQAGKAKTQADRAQTEADRAAGVAIPAQEGVTGMVVPGRGLGITTPGTLDLDIAGANALGGVQIASAADVEAGVAGEVPKVLAVGSDALNALMPTMLIGSIQTLLCADSYVPNGCVPANGGEYTRAQFPALYDTYLAGGKLLTCTYTAWAAQVAITGNCGKFALDADNQKFKVPLFKDGDSITQAASAAELGKSVKAGLPNITGEWARGTNTGPVYVANAVLSGAFKLGVGRYGAVMAGGEASAAALGFDASLSNSIYGNSTTVTDEQVRLRHFVVLASAQNSASVFDWSNYMAALAGKANTDMSNVTGNAIGFYFYARDEKNPGTNGGATSAASWHTRDINTIKYNTIPDATLSSNRVTLPAGRYYVRGRCPAVTCLLSKAAIYNATDAQYMAYGPTTYTNTTNIDYADSWVSAVITLTKTTTIELRMYAQNAYYVGLGYAVSSISNVNEAYSEFHAWKM